MTETGQAGPAADTRSVTPYWADETVTLYLGKCENVLPRLPAESVDAVVTDPPAAISFMGRDWDGNLGGRDKWVAWLAECMEKASRVLKPGGHLLVWSLPRTSGWTQWALEDAGLEVRDCIVHLFGSGFPKSLDVSKAIDRQRNDRQDILQVTVWLAGIAEAKGIGRAQVDAHMGTSDMGGWWLSRLAHRCAVPTWDQWQQLRALIGFGDEMDAEVWRLNGRKGTPGEAWEQREVVGHWDSPGRGTRSAEQKYGLVNDSGDITAPATDDAARWSGWGTALKPGQEMWWLARKPLKGTVAANVLEHGTGALNIAACKAGSEVRVNNAGGMGSLQNVSRVEHGYRDHVVTPSGEASEVAGRWPTNIVLTHSAACEPLGVREVRSDGHHPAARGAGGLGTSGHGGQDGLAERKSGTETVTAWACAPDCPVGELDRQSGVLTSGGGDRGATSRYRLMAHYSDRERVTKYSRDADTGGASRFYPTFRYQAKAPASERPRLEDGTAHETVKSLGLMTWMVKLITPPGGTVLDMFAGSGPVGEVAVIEGFRCVLIEQGQSSADLIVKRLSKAIQPVLLF